MLVVHNLARDEELTGQTHAVAFGCEYKMKIKSILGHKARGR